MSRRNRKNRQRPQQPVHNGHAEAVVVAEAPGEVERVSASDQLMDHVERAVQKGSRQERDPLGGAGHSFWKSTVEWVKKMDAMPSLSDCTGLDEWCHKQILNEPYLLGIMSRAVAAQANRGWSLYGGKRVTEATSRVLHSFDPVSVRLADGRVVIDDFKAAGWRRASKRKALSYNTRNAGTFVEMQRRLEPRFTRNGWSLSGVNYLYNMDSGKVEWTGDALYPIRYDGSEPWPNPSFYQLVSMPSDTQENYHIGLSPLFRCIRLAMLMVEISDWEFGTLSDDFIDSLIILNGDDGEGFDGAMKDRTGATLGAKKNKAKRAAVMGNIDPAMELKADIIKMRMMPDSLHNFEDRIYLLMQGYAVNLGYSLSNFIDSPTGRLMGASGSEINFIQKATSEAGGNDYHREDEEAMNNLAVPSNVEFHYDEQGIDDAEDAQLKAIRSETLKELYLAERANGESLGTTDQFRQLAILWDLFDPDWTEQEEDIRTDHDDQTRLANEAFYEFPAVKRCIHAVEDGRINDDALVHYYHNPETNTTVTRTITPSIKGLLREKQRFFQMGAPGAVHRATQEERETALAIMKKHLTSAQEVTGVAQNV